MKKTVKIRANEYDYERLRASGHGLDHLLDGGCAGYELAG